jgi:hypothetical protein
MPTDAPRCPISDAVLDEWFRLHDGKDNGAPAGLGVQARDGKIRRLIEEVRAMRKMELQVRDLVQGDTDELRRLCEALDEIASGRVTGAEAITIAIRARLGKR